VFAQGVVQAVAAAHVNLPIVVRMEGTNVQEGHRILRESGFNFIAADGLTDAAQKVVQAIREQG
jgi:succinyl-CoA synthetase beta subunit